MRHAIIRINKRKNTVTVLCDFGHLLEHHYLDNTFGGSMLEADLAFRHEGDRFDRAAQRCKGYGHAEGEQ